MAEPRLQIVRRGPGRPKKTNGHAKAIRNGNGHKVDPTKVGWESLSYKEKSALIEKLVGPRPEVPRDIVGPEWSSQAIRVLNERYYMKDLDGKVLEDERGMCWRVAWELARAEVRYGKTRAEIEAEAREFYRMMLNRWFLPNSPTLMNAGKENGLQYSACYVIPVPDSLEGIFDGVKWQGIVHQSGGGTGFSFSRLRPKGSRVKSSMGTASGPVSFMRVYNEATQQIKQGGTRRGANMGILRVDHPDVMEFIHSKDDGVGITNFNISLAITDEFMDAVEKGTDYTLYAPHTDEKGNHRVAAGKLSARMVWDEIAQSAWKTGDPGMIFLDRMNNDSANPMKPAGWEVESTNPCGEQPLYPFDACNLGSIFLNNYVRDGGTDRADVDWDKLRDSVHTAVRMLDDVIEMNPFPLPQIADTVRNIRRIGLGVGGWADMLVKLEIPYDSEEALELGEKIMKFINDEGHRASQNLASERGAFPLWKQSIYAGDKPIRNSTVTTIAPTGSISILADTSSGIEPLFAIAYRHVVKIENRELTFVNPLFEKKARDMGFYSDEVKEKVASHGTVREISEIPENVRRVFGTAHEIRPDWHVKMQAAFQKYTDNAVSKTINLPHEATVEDIKRAYKLAWDTGCQGITVFRDGCKNEQVLNLGTKSDEKKDLTDVATLVEQAIKPRPVKVEGATYKIETPLGSSFITVNHDSDGNPFEVFVAIGKAGSEVAAMAEALGRMISTTLRFGNHLPAKERAKELIDQLQGIGGGRSVGFGPNKVRSLPDAVAKAMAIHFGLIGSHGDDSLSARGELPSQQMPLVQAQMELPVRKKADICPSCGEATLVFEEGCKKCHGCGYSEC